MLVKFRRGAAALAAVATFTATSAQAETHDILIVDTGYFPAVTYVQAGDTIVFRNESVIPHTITAKNNAWSTGLIALGGSFTMDVTSGMQNTFNSVDIYGVTMEGNLNFNAPVAN